DLHGKTALIQGGIHGLSAGVARSLNEAGAQIIIAYAPAEADAALALSNEMGGHAYEVQSDDQDKVREQIAAVGAFQIAVISPRHYLFKPFMDTSNAEWDAILAGNFEQAVYASQAAAHQLIRQGSGGRVIFLSSVAGSTPLLETSALGASLAALRALAKMAALDLAEHRITVNVVAAGWLNVEWAEPYLSTNGRAYIERDIPAARIGSPDDIGRACCFLASDLADYITGTVLPVDGGYTITRSDQTSPYPTISNEE
ncbi:MAG: SDR family oxidoreductase, partial [Burkholderiales bacterium]|nr:SDR family oxidoreductase [Anaerolineae bacterium]